jgi:protein O-GlcNAc transferase
MTEPVSDGWTDGPLPNRERLGFNLRQWVGRATSAFERDDYESALADFEEVLERHPDFPDIRNWAGLCRAMLGDPEGAIGEFEHALSVNPDYAAALLNLGVVLSDLGRLEAAAKAFSRLGELEVDGDMPLPGELGNRIAQGHAQLGELYLEAERPVQAIDECRRALEIRGGYVDVRARLAHALLMAGEHDAALAELESVLKGHPHFLEARIELGTVLRRMGRRDEAIEEWRRCLEIDPKDRRVRAYLASVGVILEEVKVRSAAGGDVE